MIPNPQRLLVENDVQTFGVVVKVVRNIWVSIKRNPVVIAFLVAVGSQAFQDWQNNKIDVSHIWGYAVMLFISVAARQFTVPAKEHEDTVDSLHEELYGRSL